MDTAEQAFGQVVVDSEPAVVGVAGQRVPAGQGVLQGLSQRGLA